MLTKCTNLHAIWPIFTRVRAHAYTTLEILKLLICVGKMYATFWEKISAPSVSLGLLQEWLTWANKMHHLSSAFNVIISELIADVT